MLRRPSRSRREAPHGGAFLDDFTVKCWGANGSGQLGLGDAASRGDNAGEMGDNLPRVSLVIGTCGDGILSGTETCDDGNNLSGDSCAPYCQLEPGN